MEYEKYLRRLAWLKSHATSLSQEEYWLTKERIESEYRAKEGSPEVTIDCPTLDGQEVEMARRCGGYITKSWSWLINTISTSH